MGGQLGSSSCFGYCIAAPQEYLARIFIVPIGTTRVWRFGGHRNFGVPPHFGRGRYVPGLKKLLRQKTSKQTSSAKLKLPNKILKVHVKKIAKTKGQLKPAKFLTTKNCLSLWSQVTDAKLESRTWTTKKKPNATRAEDSHAYVLHKLRARLAEATTLRDSRRSTGTETISSAYRKHGAVC